MNIHKNARLTPLRREEMARDIVEGRLSKADAARTYGVTGKVVARWVERLRAEGRAGMADRSSRPKTSPRRTAASVADAIVALRRQRLTGKHIAMETGVSAATVSRVLARAGLSRLKDLEPAQPVRRYERERPGEMIHIDIKKLGRFDRIGHRITGDRTGQSNSRGVGWEFVHACIDDASRVAYYASLGIVVERVMTDNGSCYRSKDFASVCRRLGLKHIRTKPYTPKTNGKAERFIQTALREWAYAVAYPTSDYRAAELPAWLDRYNWHRPHGSLKSRTPISRIGLAEDNLLRLHT
ncbi:leucine zipper domain-containing protein [Nitratireductor sp. StC3]|uniref:integrase core domain-containing protein n=1 Tax=Nitratireductor sp. StC3 TaxID=2126741 RepID=UPI000D0DA04E|nr:leucine zipper domain-containing protein [Nitratireductor sp. StC3]PSM16266.1 IS481 family transposase [Nitratireductor sp. StC3]